MNAESRRKIEMGMRALEFSLAHPDADPGYAGAAAKLEQLVARASTAAEAQRKAAIDLHAGSVQKIDLRRTMRGVHIAHMAQVGRDAGKEDAELRTTFRFRPDADTFLAFGAAGRTMAAAAEQHRELLVKHGLAATVVEEFVQLLDQFDAAVALCNAGRTAHAGATAEISRGRWDRPCGACDGWAEPAAVCRGSAAAGGLDQRQYGAGEAEAGGGGGGGAG
jgi:hypothetical protein